MSRFLKTMAGLFIAFFILASTVIVGGKAEDIPPIHLDEKAGSIKEEVKKVSSSPSFEITTSDPKDESKEDNDVELGQDSIGSSSEKTSAYNDSSEKEMPTEIPQGALDNSPALENSETNSTPTPTPSPEVTNPSEARPMPHVEKPGCGCGPSSGKAESPCVCIY